MEKIVNFRDLGGYKTKDGKIVKNDLLFRSGEITQVSDNDKIELEDMIGLKTIIDFRDEDEAKKSPDVKIKGANYKNIGIIDVSEVNPPSLDDFLKDKASPDETMKDIYKSIINSKYSQDKYKEFFEILGNDNNVPLVFHCFAGKDRTGLAAVFILSLLGVPKETIYEDYLKTNELRKKANDDLIKQLKSMNLDEKTVENMEAFLYVKKEYLDIAYEEIEKNYGNMDNYLKEALNIDDEYKEEFQKKYLR